jgi:F-type H+-transporting ATPase subunit delta
VAYTNRCAVSGGFAVVQPKSALSINAVEGYPLEDFSAEAVRAQIAEAQKVVNGGGSEQDIAEAKIELEVSCCSSSGTSAAANSGQVLESLQAHLK